MNFYFVKHFYAYKNVYFTQNINHMYIKIHMYGHILDLSIMINIYKNKELKCVI